MHQAAVDYLVVRMLQNLIMACQINCKRGSDMPQVLFFLSLLVNAKAIVFFRPRLGSIADEEEETTMNPTALEKALKNFVIRKNGLVVQPSVGTNFDSMAEAFEFYNLYSWEVGFGIRFGRSRQNSEKTKTIQDIVCICAVSRSLNNLNMVNFSSCIDCFCVWVRINYSS